MAQFFSHYDGFRSVDQEREPGSYTAIEEETIERQVTNDIVNSLEGLVPGLTINNNEGSDAPSLFLRGVGSFNNTEPLFVLDGFPIHQEDL